MRITIAAACAAVVLGAAIAGCGNGGNVATGGSSSPVTTPTPGVSCTPPPNTQVQVVYPQPNAVSVSTGTIVIAVAPQALPSTSYLYVKVVDTASQNTIGTAFGQPLTVIPVTDVPNSALVPPFSLPVYESSYFGGLFGANDTFQIYLANSSCYPGLDLKSAFST